ncbi:MAG TPA: glycogen debranching protein GlgX [Planctomycetota bacterium]|nr:glycogen debranching protein GlgX [Planctomycetota bacterium]
MISNNDGGLTSAPESEKNRLKNVPALAASYQSKPLFVTARGDARPFGATLRVGGVNFAVFSRNAQKVALVLFKPGKEEPFAEIQLDPTLNKTGDVWHIFVYDLPLDSLYGYRLDGPFAPKAGHRFNPKAIVLDPYARSISGGSKWGVPDIPHGAADGRLTRRCRLDLDEFDWEGDVPLSTPMGQTVIYELHVRGFTRHPSSGVRYPGTYLGLCEKIPYLKALGVTAVQLMPVLEFDELEQTHKNPLTGEQLKNYWGYSPLSFFSPKASYATSPGAQVREFKQMVKNFHEAGIEVILDVVYNHTAEGNENGPTISFRGLDNAIYYMLDKQGRYYNFSGCGNTLNCNHPLVRDLIIDSLTYLVAEMHVDGFRFDLASILGRGPNGQVLQDPPLIQHIAEHPLLAGTKLVAEAWDAAGLSQLGKFPVWGRWAELNGMFRDDTRRFIRSEAGSASAMAKRICGSLDIYGDSSRHPYHSINFVTSHDGFTLHDLCAYTTKQNIANGENNKDGWDDNISYNCGHEGPTSNPEVLALRQRQMRNFLTMLLISQGVPLLSQGDEFGRTQLGNNNAYCQDNEISWMDWSLAEKNAGLLRFATMMIKLRKKQFALSREQFCNRVSWHGTKVGDPDWTGQQRTLAFQMHGWHSQPDIYVMFNAHWEHKKFAIPPHEGRWVWKRLVDTSLPSPDDIVDEKDAIPLKPADHYVLSPRSAVILISQPNA